MLAVTVYWRHPVFPVYGAIKHLNIFNPRDENSSEMASFLCYPVSVLLNRSPVEGCCLSDRAFSQRSHPRPSSAYEPKYRLMTIPLSFLCPGSSVTSSKMRTFMRPSHSQHSERPRGALEGRMQQLKAKAHCHSMWQPQYSQIHHSKDTQRL